MADVELAERLNQKVEAELQANSQRRFDTVPRLDLQKVQQEINDFQGTMPSQSYLDALRRYKADVLVIGTLTPAVGGYNVDYSAFNVRDSGTVSAHTKHNLKLVAAGGVGTKREALFRASLQIARRLKDYTRIPSPHFELTRVDDADPSVGALLDDIDPVLTAQIEAAAERANRYSARTFDPDTPNMQIAISAVIVGTSARTGMVSVRFAAKLPNKSTATATAELRPEDLVTPGAPQPFRSPVVPVVTPVSPAATLTDCANCPQMVLIPAGGFQMGVPEAESKREGTSDDDARPVHPVRIGQPFYLGKYHVTRGEYAAFAKATGRTVLQPGFPQTDEHPVVNVSWDDAQAYVAWLSRTTGKSYRLPTEAEWEYAARAGTTTARYWGDSADQQCQFANGADLDSKAQNPGWPVAECHDGYVNTSPVGHYSPNRFGLYDMLGNAWQWVQDCYEASGYGGASSDGSAHETTSCSSRGLRGGSWNDVPWWLRAGYRIGHGPGNRYDVVGFRVARTFTP